MKFGLGFLVALIIAGVGFGGYYYGMQQKNIQPIVNNTVVVPTTNPTAMASMAASASLTMAENGKIAGKLCYPSQFLPEGKIVAKNITTKQTISQDYAGSQNGAKAEYSMSLPAGTYALRYEATVSKNTLYGYQTTVCKTGQETTCGDKAKRMLVSAEVKSNTSVTNYDLCDFYHTADNAPDF